MSLPPAVAASTPAFFTLLRTMCAFSLFFASHVRLRLEDDIVSGLLVETHGSGHKTTLEDGAAYPCHSTAIVVKG